MRTFMFYTEAIAVKNNAIGLIQICFRYYIGYSQDPWNRLNEHNTNSSESYTGKAKNWELKAVFVVSENRQMKLEKCL
jgi:predicted GIY-YIG superfamily endonuclease